MVLTHVDLIEKLLHYNRKFLCVLHPPSLFPSFAVFIPPSLRALISSCFYRPSNDPVAAMERSKDKAAY